MQKRAESTPPLIKGKSYFKYEMKDTNQLIKQLFSCSGSDVSTRSGENKQETKTHDRLHYNQTLFQPDKKKIQSSSVEEKYFGSTRLSNTPAITKKDYLLIDNQDQNNQNSFSHNNILESPLTFKRKKSEAPMQQLMLSKFFKDDDQNDDSVDDFRHSFAKNRSKDLELNGNQKNAQDFQQNKKLKKGLANISLRVKNIVSQHKKLTYKQVSDLVLKYSQQQISQLPENQKIRQIKNIKRRVYDALNVLVAVGILGKNQRNVCMTEWTNVPGKKLSNHWQKVNSQIQYLQQLKKKCSDKKQLLNFLIDKYNAFSALKKKNSTQAQLQNNDNNLQKINQTRDKQDPKLSFPVIVFYAQGKQDQDNTLTVQLQKDQEGDDDQVKQRIKVRGKNLGMMGDLDFATELNLQQHRDFQAQKKLLQDLEECALSQHKPNYEEQPILTRAKMQQIQNEMNNEQNNISKYLQQPLFDHD